MGNPRRRSLLPPPTATTTCDEAVSARPTSPHCSSPRQRELARPPRPHRQGDVHSTLACSLFPCLAAAAAPSARHGGLRPGLLSGRSCHLLEGIVCIARSSLR